ncbi:hypothetical protein GCM10009641_08990 [Mycobacterium cookii]|uniref:UvrD-like helicase ATP-binding domain-containing protein n=1 Tax=Mycobacterium cookii TaxID=1775 RepID=A0A7I7L201_9MYCO|nr:AAA family ATPase [Mycobacterium cookii]MCV7329910.1 AAA family ATPase [Mycobacterium cookii]BBX48057.1 hypothetical protein MCOO_40720 [Mycobacterium cookii]
MSNKPKDLELEDERTSQKQYTEVLMARARKPSAYQGPRNSTWVGGKLPKKREIRSGELVGRVALIRPDEEILDGEADFYIGETYANINGINVFGWTAPIACTFFRGSDHHYMCDDVAVVRAFSRQNGQIVDFIDEALRADAPEDPFKKRALTIPAPPKPPSLPTLPPAVTDRASRPNTIPEEALDSHPASTSKETGGPTEELPPLRAEGLLRAQMLAPRTKSLAPVLSTLQPDQYSLVTIPAMDSVIIEGQPGTGKTIVASHRAAYLVNEETPPENGLDGDVLLVGPTAGYSRHVRQVVARLTGDTERVKVLSVHELADLIIGGKKSPHGGVSRSYQDVDWRLAKFSRSAIVRLKAAKGVTPTPEQVYEYLRSHSGIVTPEKDWSLYLRQLPPYKKALTQRVHAPLVAFIKWEIARPTELANIEHVIVDEAQDVTPLEWLLLDEINEADAWTVLGDLHQRRSDHTLGDWAQVLEVIAIDPETPIRQMKRGYRSTKPILDFANRLLPRAARKTHALQDVGPDPAIHKVSPKELDSSVVREVKRLTAEYSTGTVAVISPTPSVIETALRTAGWRTSDRGPQLWEKNGREVTVTSHDAARGLEFDAVVVVEPADFPENFSRKGPLYTALTRGNRELSIVHSSPLPNELRRK